MLMAQLLKDKKHISFQRKCKDCLTADEYEIPIVSDTSSILLEYRFHYNSGTKIADVAYLDNNEIVCIFEICNTHRIHSVDRPEPWFEINASWLINYVNTNINNDTFTIECIRDIDNCSICEENKAKRKRDYEKIIAESKQRYKERVSKEIIEECKNMKINNIYDILDLNDKKMDNYIRYVLGQTEFTNIILDDTFIININPENHQKFHFNAQNDIDANSHNQAIISKFSHLFEDIDIILKSCKGLIGYIILPKKESNVSYTYDILNLPECIRCDGKGTIDIIKSILISVSKYMLTGIKVNDIQIKEEDILIYNQIRFQIVWLKNKYIAKFQCGVKKDINWIKSKSSYCKIVNCTFCGGWGLVKGIKCIFCNNTKQFRIANSYEHIMRL